MIRIINMLFLTLLVGCSSTSRYIHNDTNVYWVKPDYSNPNHIKGKKVPIYGVDLPSFKILKKDMYAIDKNTVYYYGIPIPFADPSNFKILQNEYAIDKNHLFLADSVIATASPEHVKFFKKSSRYIRNKNYIFYKKQKFKPCDIETFTPITKQITWAIDSKCAYYEDQLIDNADVKTFKPLNFQYAKDKNGIFYQSVRLKVADLNTFKTNSWSKITAQDSHNCYRGASLVDCKTGKANKRLSNNEGEELVTSIVDSLFKQQSEILEKAQRDQNANLKKITTHLRDSIGSPPKLKNLHFDNMEIGTGFSLISSEVLAKKISFELTKKEQNKVIFNTFKSDVYGLMSLEFNQQGKVIKEPAYTGRSYQHILYKEGKCNRLETQCIEDSTVVLTTGSYTQQQQVNVSYKEGVWRRTIELPNGTITIESYVYDNYGLPVYYSKESGGRLTFEMIREDLKTLILN